jgi:hypothetical protein
MGNYTCEVTGKCPTGVIASTGLDGLRDILEAFEKGGDSTPEIEITVSGKETVSYKFRASNMAEIIELLRLTTGK